MNEPELIQREKTLLSDLARLVEDRHQTESQLESDLHKKRRSIEEGWEQLQQTLSKNYETEKARLESEYETLKRQIETTYEEEQAKADQEYEANRNALETRLDQEEEQAKTDYEEAKWTANSVYEGNRKGPKRQYEQFEKQLEEMLERVTQAQDQARKFIEDCNQRVDEQALLNENPPQLNTPDAFQTVQDCVGRVEYASHELRQLSIPTLFKGARILSVFMVILLLAIFPSGWATNWVPGPWGLAALGSTVGVGILVTLILRIIATNDVHNGYEPVVKYAALAEMARQHCLQQFALACENQRLQMKAEYDAELERIDQRFAPLLDSLKQKREIAWQELEDDYRRRSNANEQRQIDELAQCHGKYPKLLTELEAKYKADLEEGESHQQMQMDLANLNYERGWENLVSRWQRGLEETKRSAEEIQQRVAEFYPDWQADTWEDYQPNQETPPVVSLGNFTVDLTKFENGTSEHPRLSHLTLPPFEIPAMVGFPQQGSVFFKTNVNSREIALTAIQNHMLRLFTGVPAGKVRFTLIDPVGLGQNFAAFMHLADYNELLITNRIWTESQHIEQRLSDVTAHMENVIQKYLRNEFETIDEYNDHAGEIAEPYRFVVVADFPVNFTDAAARRLVSIAQSGPRCGVYVLAVGDAKQPLPSGFTWKELESECFTLKWKDGSFNWPEPELRSYPLTLEQPPENKRFVEIIHKAGAAARDAHKVEVPFHIIAPTKDAYWSGDTRSGVEIPLGRAGATKRQSLTLGKGTSQHVLIAGKTGSGKSTLLHALITNSALQYSPDEIELYLIDFKKGVEFKTYAQYKLPHARVVAIESEREFGLSVMQRLDAELKRRGDLFRSLNVQDLRGYRELGDQPPMPRVLFIVDEFQEFFVEDDKLSQDVSLLLDRLVRQGRAFGIHVIFGSQTLGGSYSMPRSTIGQMAVRIALQCSETDAHLILSEENSAARLLTRPGEAIYNDANGLVEGNNPFQVCWLDEEEREDYLREIHELDRKQSRIPRRPQIVFEGNIPAELPNNHLLTENLERPESAPRFAKAWLGDAIAIKDPTAAFFERQNGRHLLVVGQQEEAAVGILTSSFLSLVAQHPYQENAEETNARFYLFDGSPLDSARHGKLERLAAGVPHPTKVVGKRDLGEALSEIVVEIERRQTEDLSEAPAIYLLIQDLGRLRDLRKQEDDFSFSRMDDDKPPTPDKLFGTILQEGPNFGVHVIAWCDTLTNVQRTLDRAGVREFEMRVLFQMSVNDSSTLIDSPQASRLGTNRALFFDEERGTLEKFRPYAWPTDAWLADFFKRIPRLTAPEKAS